MLSGVAFGKSQGWEQSLSALLLVVGPVSVRLDQQYLVFRQT